MKTYEAEYSDDSEKDAVKKGFDDLNDAIAWLKKSARNCKSRVVWEQELDADGTPIGEAKQAWPKSKGARVSPNKASVPTQGAENMQDKQEEVKKSANAGSGTSPTVEAGQGGEVTTSDASLDYDKQSVPDPVRPAVEDWIKANESVVSTCWERVERSLAVEASVLEMADERVSVEKIAKALKSSKATFMGDLGAARVLKLAGKRPSRNLPEGSYTKLVRVGQLLTTAKRKKRAEFGPTEEDETRANEASAEIEKEFGDEVHLFLSTSNGDDSVLGRLRGKYGKAPPSNDNDPTAIKIDFEPIGAIEYAGLGDEFRARHDASQTRNDRLTSVLFARLDAITAQSIAAAISSPDLSRHLAELGLIVESRTGKSLWICIEKADASSKGGAE